MPPQNSGHWLSSRLIFHILAPSKSSRLDYCDRSAASVGGRAPPGGSGAGCRALIVVGAQQPEAAGGSFRRMLAEPLYKLEVSRGQAGFGDIVNHDRVGA